MKEISMRQLMVLLFIALLAPAAEVLPYVMTGTAGTAAYLAPLFAGIPIFILMKFLFRNDRPRMDLGVRIETAWGTWAGRAFALLFLLWGIFLLSVQVARCGKRLAASGGTPLYYIIAILILVTMMACGNLSAIARAAQIFALAIGTVVVIIAIFTLFRIRPEYVFLIERTEWQGIPYAVISVLGIVAMGSYACFVGGNVTARSGDNKRATRWTAVFFVVLSLITVAILGRFGAALTVQMERPFFQMVAGIGMQGAFQRLEALISAVWVLGDLALLSFLLFVCKRLMAQATQTKERAWQAIVVGVLAIPFGVSLIGSGYEFAERELLTIGGLIIGIIIGVLYIATGSLKRKSKESENKC